MELLPPDDRPLHVGLVVRELPDPSRHVVDLEGRLVHVEDRAWALERTYQATTEGGALGKQLLWLVMGGAH